MKNTFVLDDDKRFARVLFFAAALHLFLLVALDLTPKEALPLTKIMATILDVTINAKANQQSPTIALNIASQNHDSPILDSEQSDELESQNERSLENSIAPAHSLKSDSRLQPKKPKQDSLPEANEPKLKASRHANKKAITRRRTISAASHQSKDAAYLARWQSYVEEYGNNHYPSTALKNNLKGNLRLLVAVNKDGSLNEISIRQSSGSPILDQAAIDIVMQAAPFEPLPPEIACDIEVLEIIRTWQFRGTLSTQG